ncbi:MAG: Flp pilus assembly protein TadD [Planctomycetota bacterium]|jgi:Flp pilus assembly protein TadD
MNRMLSASLIACSVAILGVAFTSCGEPASDSSYAPRAEGTLTFNRDIAPIIFDECSACHRPGGGAPFDLLSYSDVRSRSGQIAFVVEDRYMPPWLPKVGHVNFVGERSLSEDEIGMIAQWSDEGSKEGESSDLPTRPNWSKDWSLGKPDLVIELPEAFALPADGPDVYRNFVLNVELDKSVHVRALEFNPGNPLVVHHAFVLLDPTSTSRQLDGEAPGAGFGDLMNMELPETVINPGDGGFFHGWNPGKRAFPGYDDMSWPLDSSMDVVLQLHMRPSGKPEQVRPSIALYFADKLPARFPLVIGLRSAFLDIPAGDADYFFEEEYTLPADVDVLGILPHAHYIGKDLLGYAELPDGTRQELIHIEDWDFNWQGDYLYKEPVFLPKGTRIVQRYSYDNSSSNPRNPVSPPIRVRAGGSSLDEMGELWLQVLPRNPGDRALLQRDSRRSSLGSATRAAELELGVIENEMEREAMLALQKNPKDWEALLNMAKCRGFQNRQDEALTFALQSINAAPLEAEPHCMYGHLMIERDVELAFSHLLQAIQIQPTFANAHLSIGLAWKKRGYPLEAEQAFQKANQLSPKDPLPLFNLGVLAAEQGKLRKAVALLQRTLAIEPRFKPASNALARIRSRGQQGGNQSKR